MDADSKRKLEQCVLRILEHGDMNRMTESKVRKLAAEETGFDLSDPVHRKVVKRVVEEFFLQNQDTMAKPEEDLKSPKSSGRHERRRNLIIVEEDEDEEGEKLKVEPRKRPTQPPVRSGGNRYDIESLDDEDDEEEEAKVETVKTACGRKEKRRNVVKGDEEVEEGRKMSDRSLQTSGRNDSRRPVRKGKDVEDEEDEESEHEKMKPASRNGKGSARNKGRPDASEEDYSDGEEKKIPTKKRHSVSDEDEDEMSKKRPKRPTNDDGDTIVCQLSKMRSVSVQNFKGKMLVSIREYYEKDGKLLPSRKGISLTVDQWEAFKDGIPDIEAAIKRMKQ